MTYQVAVGIPTLNERNTIAQAVTKIDQGLKQCFHPQDCLIINMDSKSNDGTREIFQATQTSTRKHSLLCELGKGNAMIDFWQYAAAANIPYVLTIDADVRSITPTWIPTMLQPLITGKADFIVPNYQRSRFGGNVTNHLAFPLLLAIFGQAPRQPLAGDFGYSHKFYQQLLQQPTCVDTFRYGIDVFITYTALQHEIPWSIVDLGRKDDRSGFSHQEQLFIEVTHSALFGIYQYFQRGKSPLIYQFGNDHYYNHVDDTLDFPQAPYLDVVVQRARVQFFEFGTAMQTLLGPDYSTIAAIMAHTYPELSDEQWLMILTRIIKGIQQTIDPTTLLPIAKLLLPLFRIRLVTFWRKAQQLSSIAVNNQIVDQAIRLRQKMKQGELN